MVQHLRKQMKLSAEVIIVIEPGQTFSIGSRRLLPKTEIMWVKLEHLMI